MISNIGMVDQISIGVRQPSFTLVPGLISLQTWEQMMMMMMIMIMMMLMTLA